MKADDNGQPVGWVSNKHSYDNQNVVNVGAGVYSITQNLLDAGCSNIDLVNVKLGNATPLALIIGPFRNVLLRKQFTN